MCAWRRAFRGSPGAPQTCDSRGAPYLARLCSATMVQRFDTRAKARRVLVYGGVALAIHSPQLCNWDVIQIA